MKIRKGRSADISSIVKLNRTLAVGPRAADLLEWADRREITRDVNKGRFYVAVMGDRVVGAACVDRPMYSGRVTQEIETIAVAPGMKRQGIGRALIGRIEHDLIARGMESLWVSTMRSYRATKFYQRLGFEVLENERDHVTLVKVLSQ